MRIDRSPTVHDPQRLPCRDDHATDDGTARPPRYCADSWWARRSSAASDGRRPASDAASRPSILSTHSASCARVKRAGIATTVRPSSRHAETVRVRRRERRTSTGDGLATHAR